MQVVIHVNSYFDWEPVPADVIVTSADEAAHRVKAAKNGGFLMKVEKDADTHITVNVVEHDLWSIAAGEMTRGAKQIMTREQLVHRLVSRDHLSEHAHIDSIQEIEVHDDGIDEAGYRAYLAEHVNAIDGKTGMPNIDARDVDRMVAAYMAPSSSDAHVDHLHRAYGVPTDKVAASQALRQKAATSATAANTAHLGNLATVAAAAGGDAAAQAAAAKRFADAVAASNAKSATTTNTAPADQEKK